MSKNPPPPRHTSEPDWGSNHSQLLEMKSCTFSKSLVNMVDRCPRLARTAQAPPPPPPRPKSLTAVGDEACTFSKSLAHMVDRCPRLARTAQAPQSLTAVGSSCTFSKYLVNVVDRYHRWTRRALPPPPTPTSRPYWERSESLAAVGCRPVLSPSPWQAWWTGVPDEPELPPHPTLEPSWERPGSLTTVDVVLCLLQISRRGGQVSQISQNSTPTP